MPTAVGTEYLVIDGYPMSNPAVRVQDHTPLWRVEYRATILPVPYVQGGVSFPTRLDVPSVVLPGIVVGEVDSDGAATTNARQGLTDNIDELYAAVLAPVTTGDGTRAAEWYRGDGTVATADVQVTNFDVRTQDAGAVSFSLTIAVIPGRFVAP